MKKNHLTPPLPSILLHPSFPRVHALRSPGRKFCLLYPFCGCEEGEEEVEVEDDEDAPIVVAINVGESGGIGPALITRTGNEKNSVNTRKKQVWKKDDDIPPNRSLPQLNLPHLRIPTLIA